MTREKLLSLSDKDLIDLAYLHGIVVDFSLPMASDDKEELVDDILEDFESFAKNSALHASLKRYEFTADTRVQFDSKCQFNFPKSYGSNALYAVLRDPYWLFVDYEIEVNTYLAALSDKGFGDFFIRVSSFDNNDKLIESNDVSIKDMTGFLFVQLFHSNAKHRVALFADINNLDAMIISSKLIDGSPVLRPKIIE